MARVYLATDTELSTPVALKVLSEELLESSEARLRLRREAHNAAKLRGHPHIATFLDLIHVDVKGRQFPVIVMEYVEGKSCAEHLGGARDQPQPGAALGQSDCRCGGVRARPRRAALRPEAAEHPGDSRRRRQSAGLRRGARPVRALDGRDRHRHGALHGARSRLRKSGSPKPATSTASASRCSSWSRGGARSAATPPQRPRLRDSRAAGAARVRRCGLTCRRRSTRSSIARWRKRPAHRPQSMRELRQELDRHPRRPGAAVCHLDARLANVAAAIGTILAVLTFVGFVSSMAFDLSLGRRGPLRRRVGADGGRSGAPGCWWRRPVQIRVLARAVRAGRSPLAAGAYGVPGLAQSAARRWSGCWLASTNQLALLVLLSASWR